MIQVLIVDDQPLVRAGLHTILENADGVTPSGEAANGVEAVHSAEHLQPDVVLMDLLLIL